MADILVSGVPSVALTSKPKASSSAYAVATAIGYAFPYQYNLVSVAEGLQAHYGTQGELTTDNIQDALIRTGVKFLSLQSLVDNFNQSGNADELRQELSAEERAHLIHLLVLKDDSRLAQAVPLSQPDEAGNIAVDGDKLHPWSKGVSYALVRAGFSDTSPWGYYKDPVLALSPFADFADPTPILWSTIVSCGIAAIIAVLPGTVTEAPPVDFRYYAGRDEAGNDKYNVWPPAAAPAVDVTNAIQSIEALRTASQHALSAVQQEVQRLQAEDTALVAILKELNPNLQV